MQRLTWLQSLFLRRCHTPAYSASTNEHTSKTALTSHPDFKPVRSFDDMCLLFLSQLIVSNSFAHGTPLVSVLYFTGAARRVRASRACSARPAAPRYRARANGIHYGTHSVPRLQLMGHIRFHRTEAPTSVNNFYSHYASKYVAIFACLRNRPSPEDLELGIELRD